ncbi:hypothetical protein QNM99_20585 [Pseudomonas sp. PCH446]
MCPKNLRYAREVFRAFEQGVSLTIFLVKITKRPGRSVSP